MRFLTFVSVGAVAACLPAISAAADQDWKAIVLEGKPDFTVDLPAGIHNDERRPAGMPMVTAFGLGDDMLFCTVDKHEYSKEIARSKVIAMLAALKGANFCEDSDKDVSGYEAITSQETTSNGLPAAACASAYTKTSEKYPGIVHATVTVAAKHAIFLVTCLVQADNQADAESDWKSDQGDAARHVLKSLHLPASEQ
jgi:hypothetical protein